MNKLMSKWFSKWAKKSRISHKQLLSAIDDLETGSFIDLGGGLQKIRMPGPIRERAVDIEL